MARPTQEEVERGVGALIPFVQEWRVALNPEDLAQLASAVLEHYDSDESWEQIDVAVREQIAEHRRSREAIEASYRDRSRPSGETAT